MLLGAGPQSMGFGDIHEPEIYVDLFDLSKPFPFPGSMQIGEIAHVRSQLEKVPHGAHNESYAMVEAFRKGMEVVLDHECEIFQEGGVHRGGEGTGVELREGRIYNAITGTNPCMVHFGGGYVSPKTGKDDAIKPWAKALGIIP